MKATPEQIRIITALKAVLNRAGGEEIELSKHQIDEVLNVQEALTFEEGQQPVINQTVAEVDALTLVRVNAQLKDEVAINDLQLSSLKALFKSLIATVAEKVESAGAADEDESTDAEKRTWRAVVFEAGKWTAATGAGVAVGALTGGLGWVAMGVGGAVGAGALGVKRAVTARKKAVSTEEMPLVTTPVTEKSSSFAACNCASSPASNDRTIGEGKTKEEDDTTGLNAGGN